MKRGRYVKLRFLSQVLAAEPTYLVEVDEGASQLWFGPV